MKKILGVLLFLFLLCSFVLGAGSQISTNFIINEIGEEETISYDDGVSFGSYFLLVLVVLILIFVFLKFKNKKKTKKKKKK